MKFALLTLADKVEATDFIFFATAVQQLSDQRRHCTLSVKDITLMNLNTRTCPLFRSRMDAELTKKIYDRVPVLIDETLGESGNYWRASFCTRLFRMAEDSHLFHAEPAIDRHPLYEAKMIHLYDCRWATYLPDGSCRDAYLEEKQDPSFQVRPRYWIQESELMSQLSELGWQCQWLMGWRDICRSTDERTNIASIIPLGGVGDPFLLIMPRTGTKSQQACLLGDMSSLSLSLSLS